MIVTTRFRISSFMNRFCRLGFNEYDGHTYVHKPLMNVVCTITNLCDNAENPNISNIS
jgi:hypothetical protein